VAAIERQGFVVAGLGQPGTARVMVQIAEMPHRVGEPEGLVHLAEDGNRLFIMLPRSPGVRQTSLELPQIPEGAGQSTAVTVLAQEIDGFFRD
jgi:hypothetical protein